MPTSPKWIGTCTVTRWKPPMPFQVIDASRNTSTATENRIAPRPSARKRFSAA
jgi:hypothetical protein